MADVVEKECPECKKGAPDWMVTFSDLMTLLLTFFVLLLSVSIIDDPKFEDASESIRDAFQGVHVIGEPQRDLVVVKIFDQANEKIQVEKTNERNTELDDTESYDSPNTETGKFDMAQIIEEIVQEQIAKEVDYGIAEIENKQDKILIRFPAEATFDPGSAEIKQKMLPVIEQLAVSLKDLNVKAVVNGHTDNVPISTAQFRSNWDLSAARAASVAMVFENNGDFKTSELQIKGHADGEPLVPNDSPENRQKNRRIELFIEPYDPDFSEDIFNTVIEETMPDFYKKDTTLSQEESEEENEIQKEKNEKKIKEEKKSWLDNTIEKIRNFGGDEKK